jgi:DNA polymerase V
MDIVAKHIPADKDGVRIAELDEMSYRKTLWDHKPLTSFWRIGHGTAYRLGPYGIDTMGKLARMSIENEALLHKLFGIHAELLIDHAWGYEPCTMEYIKAYRPTTHSLNRGQVLKCPYDFTKARIVVQEMAGNIALLLVEKRMVTNQLALCISYDTTSLKDQTIRTKYSGEVRIDHYGRQVPKHANGTTKLGTHTSSSRMVIDAIMALYDKIVNPDLLVRRINISANNIIDETEMSKQLKPAQLDLFIDYEEELRKKEEEQKMLAKERRIQEAQLAIKKRFGKNAILNGISFAEGATAKERNMQIGGHKE